MTRPNKSFKQRKSFTIRKEEANEICVKFPGKYPVIVERYHKEKNLPELDRIKYFVPKQLTMAQFVSVIRTRMQLSAEQSLYFLVNNKHVVSMSMTIQQVYQEEKDDDGFVYMTYASCDMFG